MVLHFNKKLQEFDYLLCFDLAKFETGVSLINIKDLNNPILQKYYQISVDKKSEEPFGAFYGYLVRLFTDINKEVPELSKILIIREKQPTGFTVTTTISTLQALAGVHAILDVFVSQLGLTEYEFGIHASTVKAWARRETGLDKPQKEDIKAFLENIYPELKKENVTLDISDSVALAQCLIKDKWNSDLKELIKEEKKHLKELKSDGGKKKQQEKIDILLEKLIKGE